uniref:Septin 4a n=1 Tax=Sander lucioperca TaxID=283035 RepID=A0A8C9XQU0_SANLU
MQLHTCFVGVFFLQDQDKEYVGFATLPNQVHRKTVKKGFTFTIMVAGVSGLGKSTLINTLFLTDLYKDRKVPNAQEQINQTVNIVKHTISIEEKGIKLRLTIIDTPGFGDAVDNTESWKPIEDYIDQQFEQYFRDESGLNRRNIQDNRVHCCLYFISPFGHGLRPLDVACMKALQEKVNIVPVVAKADSLTQAEVYRKKMKIREEIKQYGINIYQFPECDSDEDEDFKNQDQILKDSIPFAVIGSNVQVESEGHKFRGRVYPWGLVEVENPAHSDFLLLRNMLMRTHMQDLKDVTGETHYENYRAQCIQNMTRMVVQKRKRRSLIEQSEADFPLPLAAGDTETERLIFEKDEEVRFSYRLILLSLDAATQTPASAYVQPRDACTSLKPSQMRCCVQEHFSRSHWLITSSEARVTLLLQLTTFIPLVLLMSFRTAH